MSTHESVRIRTSHGYVVAIDNEILNERFTGGEVKMTKEQSQTTVIASLKSQLDLAVFYIRSHINHTDPDLNDAFMLRFADTCERVATTTLSDNVIERYELLRDLEMNCRPYLNYLHTTGKHNPHFENKMRETIIKLSKLEAGTDDH